MAVPLRKPDGAAAFPASMPARELPPALRLDEAAARTARTAVVVAALAAAGQGTMHVLNETVLGGALWHADADSDWNALAWLASAVLLTAGLAAYVLGLAERRRERMALGVVLAVLALDEVIALHERVALLVTVDLLGLPYGNARAVWPAALLPLLAVVFVLLLRAARTLLRPSRRLILAGLALLVTAVALEAVSALIVTEPGDEVGALYALQVAAEEGAELAGWILVVGGLVGGAYAAVVRRLGPAGPRPLAAVPPAGLDG